MTVMATKTIKLVDNGKTYEIGSEEGFKKLLESLQTPLLEHLETMERVSRFTSLVPDGTYRTKQHAETVSDYKEKSNFVRRLGKVAHQLWRQGEYDRAGAALELILSHQKKLFGGDRHPDIVQTHIHMGALKSLQGDFEGGVESYEAALELALKVYSPEDHSKLAEISTPAGHLLLNHLDRPMQALSMYNCTLGVQLKFFGEQSEQHADACSNCGLALERLGNYHAAIIVHQGALSTLLRIHGKYHFKVAQVHCNIASALNRQGQNKYEQARMHYQEALSIYQSLEVTEL